MKKLIFDTPSIIYVIKRKAIDIVIDNYIQWLTLYEVLNAIWKEAYIVKSITINEARMLNEIFGELLSLLNIVEVRGKEEEILEIAMETGLTCYDASYIVVARMYGLKLVTEDRKLHEEARKYIEVMTANELLQGTS